MEGGLLVLVDEHDRETGRMPKLEAHRKGLLHRAFSVLVWNSANELLIHKRAESKYHSQGLWTNTCCSHPLPGETVLEAAHRRLGEEMGFDCELYPAFSFIYKAILDNDLMEHEFDHVLAGLFDGEPVPNPAEVSDYRWITLSDLREEIRMHPERFTFWFRLIVEQHSDKILPDLFPFR